MGDERQQVSPADLVHESEFDHNERRGRLWALLPMAVVLIVYGIVTGRLAAIAVGVATLAFTPLLLKLTK